MKTRFELVCGFGVYYGNIFHGEMLNGDSVDIFDRQIITAVEKVLAKKADYVIFSGSFTKLLPLKNGEAPISEAMGMKNRALQLFPNHRDEIMSKTMLDNEALDSWKNLECALRLISANKHPLEWIEVISLAFKEIMFDVFARDMPMEKLGFTTPTKLEKNVNYFYHPVGEISRNANPVQTTINMKNFKEKYETQTFNPDDQDALKKRVKRDVYNIFYTQEQKIAMGVDKMPSAQPLHLEIPPLFIR